MPSYSPSGLRAVCQRLLPIPNSTYPFLLAFLFIHSFWIYYDIAITSHERHRPRREPVRVTESSPLTPFYPPSPGVKYNGYARSFPVWEHPFPCGDLEDIGDEKLQRSRKQVNEGFFYVRLLDASPSICSSVTTRIGRNVARRQLHQSHDHGGNNRTKVCTSRIGSQRAKQFYARSPQKSFLWSVVREPVDRLISKYYHYSRPIEKGGNRERAFSEFQHYVLDSERHDYGYYFRSLGVKRTLNPYEKQHEADTQELLESYDFLGISERMDESLAVLKLILNLEIEDVLYLATPKAKGTTTPSGSSIDFYQHWQRTCRAIREPDVTMEMKKWFHSEEFEAYIEADVLFYKAVNASLDKTILEIGRERVETTVRQLKWAQKRIEEECRGARFPCSSGGEFQKETDCFFADVGCGYNCIDSLSETFSQDPVFQKLAK
ncbi:unnamed protein product [Pseudo-nitzschia multistriata]|uniref:Sulfotransferase domain-containing protein n=1 Tax=Pseudo-nitzschia multistriata TaxID=183589 RepID=A0A448ZD76_9STRA|nr:unnamed protein product [Pseudo-nitzschia multistriata]